MTHKPGAMTDYELKAEIEHCRTQMDDLSPDAPARVAVQLALDAFTRECDERRELRSIRVARAEAAFPDDA